MSIYGIGHLLRTERAGIHPAGLGCPSAVWPDGTGHVLQLSSSTLYFSKFLYIKWEEEGQGYTQHGNQQETPAP